MLATGLQAASGGVLGLAMSRLPSNTEISLLYSNILSKDFMPRGCVTILVLRELCHGTIDLCALLPAVIPLTNGPLRNST